jgi:gamma-glutamylcyclotransferase (GGCT)/AIG2-like uncharacterized protein YtfP
MKGNNSFLFVYGTLLDTENEYGVYLSNNCRFYGKGKFKGILYDVGEFPAAIYQPGEEQFVYGSIYVMNDPDKTLKILDEYEGFGENEEQPNLFIRELIAVETKTIQLPCWTYLYNLQVEGLKQITSGNYKE